MMYAKGLDFIRDFALRTQENLRRLENGSYEVTQLINSIVGLLIIPEQKLFARITDSLINQDLLNKLRNCIDQNTYRREIDLREFCRHLRNAVSHSKLDFTAEKPAINSQPLVIHAVVFVDENTNTGEQIKISIPIDMLKEFLMAFSSSIINIS